MSDQPQNQPAQPAEPKTEAPKPAPAGGADQDKLLAALSYFGILFLVPMFLVKDSDFARFHVKQGIVWFVVWVIASCVMWIPFIGWSIGVAMFAISIYAAIQAYEGKRWEMPYISKYAKQIKL